MFVLSESVLKMDTKNVNREVQNQGSALTFFEHYAVEGDDFLKQIITDKET